jgi:hypothetical protein
MRVLKHTVEMDHETLVPQHDITIRISGDVIADLRCHSVFTGGLDLISEYRQAFGDEFWRQVVEPLIQRKELT